MNNLAISTTLAGFLKAELPENIRQTNFKILELSRVKDALPLEVY